MSQKLHVLKCFNCESFQVDIVKKVPKWKCKVCNEKQSVIKVYFSGSGIECRGAVQKLNSRRAAIVEDIDNIIYEKEESYLDNRLEERQNENFKSTWDQFIQKDDKDDNLKENHSSGCTSQTPSPKRRKHQGSNIESKGCHEFDNVNYLEENNDEPLNSYSNGKEESDQTKTLNDNVFTNAHKYISSNYTNFGSTDVSKRTVSKQVSIFEDPNFDFE